MIQNNIIKNETHIKISFNIISRTVIKKAKSVKGSRINYPIGEYSIVRGDLKGDI